MKNICRLIIVAICMFAITNPSHAEWVQTNRPNAGVIQCLVANGTNLFAGTFGGSGVFLSTDNGKAWTAKNNGLTDLNVFALAANGTNLFAGTFDGGVFLSTNEGTTWAAVNNGLTSTSVVSLAIAPNRAGGTNLFAAADGGGVCLSTNSGATWTAVNNGLTRPFVNVLAVSDNGAGGTNLFAGTDGDGVFLSTNNGTSWNAINNGLPIGVSILSLAGNGKSLFAGTNHGGVFLSTNNGTNWNEADTGLSGTTVNAFIFSGTNLFAGTDGAGVFLSTNNGTTWNAVNDGLTNQFVHVLAMNLKGGGGAHLFAVTFFAGDVWRRPLSETVTTVGGPMTDFPARFSLDQNYPNPFNPTTTITYRMNQPGWVSLRLFNVIGKEIVTLVDGTQAAGHHEAKFDATNFPSGVYFYKIQSGGQTETRRMVLLK